MYGKILQRKGSCGQRPHLSYAVWLMVDAPCGTWHVSACDVSALTYKRPSAAAPAEGCHAWQCSISSCIASKQVWVWCNATRVCVTHHVLWHSYSTFPLVGGTWRCLRELTHIAVNRPHWRLPSISQPAPAGSLTHSRQVAVLLLPLAVV